MEFVMGYKWECGYMYVYVCVCVLWKEAVSLRKEKGEKNFKLLRDKLMVSEGKGR